MLLTMFKIGKDSVRNRIIYGATVVLSVLFLFVGNKIAAAGYGNLNGAQADRLIKVQVEKILERIADDYSLDGSTTNQSVEITFSARILDGENKGDVIEARQIIDELIAGKAKEVEAGDKILVFFSDDVEGTEEWLFMEYLRTDSLLWLGILFVACLLLFGRMKGFNTIISLGFTCAAIFAVFIPSILSGKNIYLSSVIICVYTIVMTLMIVNGFNRKSLTAAIGCLGGVMVSGILTVIMDKILYLTGVIDEESVYLTYLSTDHPIDLKAIIFAAIIIGAMGAIMDVSMSISSSLWEISEQVEKPSFQLLVNSGINIGRDVMGTMANTLILAYIGSSLSVVLLLVAYNSSLLGLLNKEMIVVEIAQALIGSFGILFTMPLTSLVCAFFYTRNRRKPAVTAVE